MMRGSTVVRKVNLEEKRVYAPNLMIQEPYFSLPIISALTIPEVVVQEPVVTPPVATMSENVEPVLQDPVEPIVMHEEELQQPPLESVPQVEAQNVPEEEAP